MTLPGPRGGAGDERDPLAGQDIDWVQQVFKGDHVRARFTAVSFHE